MRIAFFASILLAGVCAALPARAAEGSAVYLQHCQMCHQSAGAGLAGQFPRLAGRVAAMAAVPEARPYLVHVIGQGMSGSITVDGEALVGMMPGFAQIPDADVASLLNHLITLGKPPRKAPTPFTTEEVQALRAGPALSATDTHALRKTLGIAKIAP